MQVMAEAHAKGEVDAQSLSYLASATIGRIVASNVDDVTVIPVSYVAEQDCLVFQVPSMFRKPVLECERLVFHADGVDPATAAGWSVTVRGSYSVMSGYGALTPPNDFGAPMPVWQQEEDASLWIRLRPEVLDLRESINLAC